MFSKPEFQRFSQDSMVMFVSVATQIEGRENDNLLGAYGFRGFPSMAILDAGGEKKFEGLPRDLYGMRCVLDSMPQYIALQADADAGKEVDQAAWFLAQLGVGRVDLGTARTKLESLDLTEEARTEAEGRLFALEMRELMYRNYEYVRENGGANGNDPEVVAEVYRTFELGRRLPEGASAEDFVADVLVDAGIEHSNVAAFRYGFERTQPRLEREIEEGEARLAAYVERGKTSERYRKAARSVEAGLEGMKQRLKTLRERARELLE